MARTPDEIFADPRLAALYDVFDGPRDDLPAYVDLVAELGATTVVDVGCGTGSLAVLLAERGVAVTGVDPALASLDVARGKPYADRVAWVHGQARDLAAAAYDLAVLTGNVAQVFLGEAWPAVLRDLARAVRSGGWLVFETRRPEDRAWERWTGSTVRHVPEVGEVTEQVVVTDVALPLVSFRHTYRFPDGTVATSESTLAFRSRVEVEADLATAGFAVDDVREAADRPGRELVFLAHRPG